MLGRIHRRWTAILILILGLHACNLPLTAQTKPPQPTQIIASATNTVAISTELPVASATLESATPEASATLSIVTITADGGNLNVRRGPGVGYNFVSALRKGETSTATARDESGEWLLIDIPKLAGKTGWVNANTKYSLVKGEIVTLPIQSVDPPEPAYVINCTFHPMDIYPIGISVPPQNEKPKNVVEINPGEYEVFDSTISGGSSIASITVLEGGKAQIKKDGLGNSYSCPK